MIVAPSRRIDGEWRTIVVDRKVVAGSMYRWHHSRELMPEVPEDVFEFAQSVADNIDPPAVAYVLDIANAGGLSVIELNAFSSSDFYASDPEPIVRAIAGIV